MKKSEVIKTIDQEKIIVVIRGIYDKDLVTLVRALNDGGIKCFEVTYDPTDPDTLTRIKENIELLNREIDGLMLGVGTVLTEEHIQNAYESGAKFIVSPHLNTKLVEKTNELDLVSIPGCMTPTEILAADEAGADYIKFFPAGTLGLKYCKDIFAPIHHVKYLATVGITEDTFADFLEIGFTGAGISSQLVDKKLRDTNRYDILTERARNFVSIAQKF